MEITLTSEQIQKISLSASKYKNDLDALQRHCDSITARFNEKCQEIHAIKNRAAQAEENARLAVISANTEVVLIQRKLDLCAKFFQQVVRARESHYLKKIANLGLAAAEYKKKIEYGD